jgi:hypothetical protein
MSAVLETAAPAAARRVTHAALIACERAALEHGLAAGLAAALDTAASSAALPDGGAPAPAGRIAALPADRVPAGAELIAHRLGALEGIAFVRSEPARAEDTEHTEQLTVFGALLGAARLGVSRRLLEWAVEHLSGRTVDGEPTIRKQLVLGSLADVLTRVEAARRLLLVAGSVPAAVTEVHTWITELDWESAKLLGASGFITDSPSRGGYVSRVVANCWIAHQDGAL